MKAAQRTVLTGVIGDDVHVIGIRIMEYALRQSGFKVVSLGALASQRDFIDAAVESDADAIMISSLNGHAEMSLLGFRDACVEAGIGDILVYVGGQLTIRRPDWSEVERLFVDELGATRAFGPETTPEQAIAQLRGDLGMNAEEDEDG
jgi:methylaspartate mutase sigma subunit